MNLVRKNEKKEKKKKEKEKKRVRSNSLWKLHNDVVM